MRQPCDLSWECPACSNARSRALMLLKEMPEALKLSAVGYSTFAPDS